MGGDFVNTCKQNSLRENSALIHPTAIIGPDVKIAPGADVGPFCVIIGNVSIGAGTRLHAHVAIGFPAQVLGIKESFGSVTIGENCDIREFVTIHASRYPDGKTVIGNNCYLMNYAHVAHDCILEDNVTLINNVNLGGHTHVEKQAFLMAYVATHQFCRIGQLTAFAPFSATRQDLPPYCMFDGQPASFAGLNVIGLKRSGCSRDAINALKHATKLFYQDKLALADIQKLAKEETVWGNEAIVQQFLSFIEQSSRGVSRRVFRSFDEKASTEGE